MPKRKKTPDCEPFNHTGNCLKCKDRQTEAELFAKWEELNESLEDLISLLQATIKTQEDHIKILERPWWKFWA